MFASSRRVVRGRSRERRRYTSLTGAWSGAYGYSGLSHGRGDVPFNALLNEADGALTGSTDEPNTFAPGEAASLFANLSGSRAGAKVSFVKTYDGTGGQTHSIAYEGEVNEAMTRIDGRWRGGWLSGPFFMERAVAAEEAEEREAEAGA